MWNDGSEMDDKLDVWGARDLNMSQRRHGNVAMETDTQQKEQRSN